jgi:FAD-dependent urate hydroxylase
VYFASYVPQTSVHGRSAAASMTSRRANTCKVAIVGAGPYGLSVAAHLKQAGISTRVFGEPMSFWRRHMPKGMMLRSPWRATHLSDAQGSFSVDAYAAGHGVGRDKLLPLHDFIAYGEWFQAHAVPEVDRRAVRRIGRTGGGFQLDLDDGEIFVADRVVVATGLANQEYRPAIFRDLAPSLVTHSCEHVDFAPLQGKRVAVIGRGQSACESAALLAEAGAEVELVSRGDIHWLGIPAGAATAPATPFERAHDILTAPSAVGPFPLNWFAELPGLVWRMPSRLRDDFTKRCLKAGAAGWLKPRFAAIRQNPGRTIMAARACGGGIGLDLDNGSSSFDHVVLGTGYRIDISRIGVLSPPLLEAIACADGSPLLNAGFESTVPKLHFVGSYAVKSFGPLLRFIAAVPFAARSVTKAALERTQGAVVEFPDSVNRLRGRAASDLATPR